MIPIRRFWKLKLSKMFLFFNFILSAAIAVCGEMAFYGDHFVFQLTANCKKGEVAELILRRANDTPIHVVYLGASGWSPGEQYLSRIINQSSSPVLDRVNMNDAGLYEFKCDGHVVKIMDLVVLAPYDVSVRKGESRKLQCHTGTMGKEEVKLLVWKKDEELVLQKTLGQITYGEGFNESSVSVSADWNKLGDLSLSIHAARLSDGGVYLCSNGSSRALSAVRLEVKDDKHVAPSKPPTTPEKPPPCPQWTELSTIVTSVLSVLLLIALAVLFWSFIWRKCWRKGGGRPNRRGAAEGATVGSGHADSEQQSMPMVVSNGHNHAV